MLSCTCLRTDPELSLNTLLIPRSVIPLNPLIALEGLHELVSDQSNLVWLCPDQRVYRSICERKYLVLPDSDIFTRLSRLGVQILYPLLDAISQVPSLRDEVVQNTSILPVLVFVRTVQGPGLQVADSCNICTVLRDSILNGGNLWRCRTRFKHETHDISARNTHLGIEVGHRVTSVPHTVSRL